MAEPTAEREPADAGRRDDARRRRAAVLGGRPIDLAPGAAPPTRTVLACSSTVTSVDAGEVDHQPVVDDPEAATVVAAAADRDRNVVGPRESDAAGHVVGALSSARSAPDAGRSSRCGRLAHRRSPGRRVRTMRSLRSASSRCARSTSGAVAVIRSSQLGGPRAPTRPDHNVRRRRAGVMTRSDLSCVAPDVELTRGMIKSDYRAAGTLA